MILFERFIFDRRIMDDIKHHSLTWKTPKSKHMVAISWSTIKGDWWKDREEETAQFFSVEWKHRNEDYVRTGIYIGRLALVYQTLERRVTA